MNKIVVSDQLTDIGFVIYFPIEYIDNVASPVQLLAQIVINTPVRPLSISVNQNFWRLALMLVLALIKG